MSLHLLTLQPKMNPNMEEDIRQLLAEVNDFPLSNREDAEEYKRRFTGRKGAIAGLFDSFRALPGPEKARFGKELNLLKQAAEGRLKDFLKELSAPKASAGPADKTLPGDPFFAGSRHPLSTMLNRMVSVFRKIGFTIADGPEIEDDWHNFSALNMPENHPARDMQDTFFIQTDPAVLLRTHTSNVQIRVMENQKPPIRILAPGRVYRNETISARAHCFFHQLEGLYVDKNVSFPDLVSVLDYFAKEMFGPETKVRLRPSFFPFTEISAEMDVSCMICKGKGCNVCKYTGWVEVLGCGMVDPAVLENCGIDPDVYSGYAFGMGVERMAMLTYDVNDLRIFSQNDTRFLEQFSKLES